MKLINVDKFLPYLIFSKNIDDLTCGEIKEIIKICEFDIFKMRKEIEQCIIQEPIEDCQRHRNGAFISVLGIIDAYIAEAKRNNEYEMV